MKRKFFKVARDMGVVILKYESGVSRGMGGLQFYHIEYVSNGRHYHFHDSYFHLSGDAPKVIKMFEIEVKGKLKSAGGFKCKYKD
jgi:hypothetical protein